MPDAGVGRVTKNRGRRQLFFLPAAVLKLGFDEPERRALGGEARGSAAAARHPFWGRLPVRVFGLAGTGFVSRRFRPVRLDDFDAVARVVEERLEACHVYPSQPIAAQLGGRLAGVLGLDDRDRLTQAVDGFRLPQSSMHGDLHFFNFVRAGDGFRVIDWEHFDGDGSFVYDYVNFNVSVDRLNLQRPWPEALAALGPEHPAVRRAAELTGVPARGGARLLPACSRSTPSWRATAVKLCSPTRTAATIPLRWGGRWHRSARRPDLAKRCGRRSDGGRRIEGRAPGFAIGRGWRRAALPATLPVTGSALTVERAQRGGVEAEVRGDPGRLEPPQRRAERGPCAVEVGGAQREARGGAAGDLGLEPGGRRDRRALAARISAASRAASAPWR